MKKLFYFIPAIAAAVFYGLLVFWLGASPAAIAPEALFAVQLLFAAGVLLCLEHWWGCVPGAGVGLALLWWNAHYRGHQHINVEQPVGITLVLFYAACGLWLVNRKRCAAKPAR